MENQVSSKSIILNYGMYLGLISILISLVTYAIGNHLQPHWSISLLSTVIMIIFMIMGMKKFKTDNGGFMSWGQAVKIGVGLAVISALIVTFYNLIFMNFIEPDYLTQVMAIQEQGMIDKEMSSEEIDVAMSMMKKFQGPVISSAIGLVAAAFISFIISAIAGAIMKQTPAE